MAAQQITLRSLAREGKQPHPDACPTCHRPCYASTIARVDGAHFTAGYACSCGRHWHRAWTLTTLIDKPDPTPPNNVFTPGEHEVARELVETEYIDLKDEIFTAMVGATHADTNGMVLVAPQLLQEVLDVLEAHEKARGMSTPVPVTSEARREQRSG